jgi:hypothetical protein
VTVALLDRRVYGLSDVDWLLALPPGTARRWIDGYDRGGMHYPPVVRAERTRDEEVTWGEFVETRLLAEFRARGASMHRLRPAVVRLREEFGRYPLAHARPFLDVDGREGSIPNTCTGPARIQRPTRIIPPTWRRMCRCR